MHVLLCEKQLYKDNLNELFSCKGKQNEIYV